MEFKLLSLSLALTFAVPAFAAMTDAQLGQAMRQDFGKKLITVKTPRLIFHWVDASDITPPGQYNNAHPGNAPSFRSYVEKQGSKVFRARNTRDYDIEGPGLYFATDPSSTRHYGGQKSFGLIVGLVRPGARIINGDGQNAIDPKISSELSARGCAVSSYNSLIDTSGNANCTKMKQLLVGSDISFADGRLYNYGNNVLVEGCTKRSPYKDIAAPASQIRDYEGLDTYVSYSAKLFTEIVGITHKTSVGDHALTNEILSYLKGLQLNNLVNVSHPVLSQEQLNNSAIKAMSRGEIAKFSQKYIMGCNL